MRCADIRSVMSSKVTTEPASDAALMRTSRMRRVPRCRISIWPWVSAVGPLGRLRDQRRQLGHHVDQLALEHAVLGQRQQLAAPTGWCG